MTFVNNIKNNTITKIFAKESLNVLKQIQKAEIMTYKKHTPGQKKLLNLFNDLLDTILTDEILMSSNKDNENWNENENENENENINEKENKNESKNENDKTLMSSNDDDD